MKPEHPVRRGDLLQRPDPDHPPREAAAQGELLSIRVFDRGDRVGFLLPEVFGIAFAGAVKRLTGCNPNADVKYIKRKNIPLEAFSSTIRLGNRVQLGI